MATLSAKLEQNVVHQKRCYQSRDKYYFDLQLQTAYTTTD